MKTCYQVANLLAMLTQSSKVIGVGIVVALLLPFAVFAQNTSQYDGIGGHPYYDALTSLKIEGVMRGYPDGLFRPDNVVNRAEFMKIVLLANHIEPSGQDCFPDVRREWFAPWVCAATERGIVSGYPDGLFRPERTISFAEAAKMLTKTLGGTQTEDSPWYRGFTEYLASKQAIPPSITGFDHLITRGETAAMVWLLRPEDDYGKNNMKAESLNYEKLKNFTEAQSDYVLDFKGTAKKIVLNGTRVNWLCTPAFSTAETERAAWEGENADTFYPKYCPTATASPTFGYPDYFPYFTDVKAFTKQDPGGYQEMRLMTDAEIRAYEKELTRPVTLEGGFKTWTNCKTEQRVLAEGITAKTLTCTNYHQEEGSNAPANWLIPNTHCFVPVSKSLYFAYRIPMSAMDTGADGCRQLKWWGIRSIRLK